MANSNKLNDPSRAPLGKQPHPGPGRLHTDLQVDPELAEGPASNKRIIAFGVAIVVVLGAVFYGLNNSAQAPDATSASSAQSTPAAATPDAGMTTGTAPASPQQPKSGPTGTEVDRSKGGNNSPAK